MQWKEDTTAGSRMSTGRSAYDIRTTATTIASSFSRNVTLLNSRLGLHTSLAGGRHAAHPTGAPFACVLDGSSTRCSISDCRHDPEIRRARKHEEARRAPNNGVIMTLRCFQTDTRYSRRNLVFVSAHFISQRRSGPVRAACRLAVKHVASRQTPTSLIRRNFCNHFDSSC